MLIFGNLFLTANQFDVLNDPEMISQEINKAFKNSEFDLIEDYFNKSDQSNAKINGSHSICFWIMNGLDSPLPIHLQTDSSFQWNEMKAQHLKWIAKKPNSFCAYLAYANFCSNLGAEARGTGYANTVTDEGWKKLHQYGMESLNYCKVAVELNPKNIWGYSAWLDLFYHGILSAEEEELIYQQAIKIDPLNYSIAAKHVSHLLEKWGGSYQQSHVFFESYIESCPQEIQDIQYSLLVYATSDEAQILEQVRDGILSWDRVKKGFRQRHERYGTSPHMARKYANMAWHFWDRDFANEIDPMIQGRYASEVFNRDCLISGFKSFMKGNFQGGSYKISTLSAKEINKNKTIAVVLVVGFIFIGFFIYSFIEKIEKNNSK